MEAKQTSFGLWSPVGVDLLSVMLSKEHMGRGNPSYISVPDCLKSVSKPWIWTFSLCLPNVLWTLHSAEFWSLDFKAQKVHIPLPLFNYCYFIENCALEALAILIHDCSSEKAVFYVLYTLGYKYFDKKMVFFSNV